MFRSMLFLLVIWILLAIVATSCATSSDIAGEYDGGIVYNAQCTTKIELRNGSKFEVPEDLDHLVRAEDGCVRHYGSESCLIRFIKTGKLSYYAVCKRKEK
jgi:hypothetical protein